MQAIRRFILLADLGWIVVAMVLACLLRHGWVWNASVLTFVPHLVASLGLWLLVSFLLEVDGFRGGWSYPAILSQLFVAILGLMVTLLAVAYFQREQAPHLALSYFALLLFVGFLLIRCAVRLHLKSLHRAGAVRRVVVVGSGPIARELAAKIARHPEMLCNVVGFLCPAEVATGSPFSSPNAIRTRTFGVIDILRGHNVNEIILALPKPSHPEVLDLAARCRNHGIAVSLVPDPYELYLSKTQFLDLDGLPLLRLQDAVTVSEPTWQRVVDLTVAICLAPLWVPVVLISSALLKYKKGHAFCRELRCGKHGNPFWMYRLNSERFASNLSRYELFLQHLSVTELPQLWNVLRGEMSLVGPRPESPEKVKHYSNWQRQRLNAKPGITGLAQVHGLRDQHPSEDKTRFDLQYMLNRSPFIDISLLLQTFWTLAGRTFQMRLFNSRPKVREEEHRPDLPFQESLTSAHSTQSSAD